MRELDNADKVEKAKEVAERQQAAKDFFDKLDQEHAQALQAQAVQAKADEVDNFFKAISDDAELRQYFGIPDEPQFAKGAIVPSHTGQELALLEDFRAQANGFTNAAEEQKQYFAIMDEINSRMPKLNEIWKDHFNKIRIDPKPGSVKDIVDDLMFPNRKPAANVSQEVTGGDISGEFFGGKKAVQGGDLSGEFF